MKTFIRIFKVLGHSILVFCSISFLSLLSYISSPINKTIGYSKMKLGFPFIYYEEFMVNCEYPNHGWRLDHLFFDVMIALVIVMSTTLVYNKLFNRQH